MAQMIDLFDLLKHQIADLYSAETQIIEALPGMIEKAKNRELTESLKDHLNVTKVQLTRLSEVQKLINEVDQSDTKLGEQKEGFFSRLFGGSNEKCKAMEGLISEGESIMGEDMIDEVMDAAIIGAAQKIEHYEIAGYGTARAYADELQMDEVSRLLSETLKEEYNANDTLTMLATGKINIEAEQGLIEEKKTGGSRKETKSKDMKGGKEAGSHSATGNSKTGKSGNSRTKSKISSTKTSALALRTSPSKSGGKSGGKNSGKSSATASYKSSPNSSHKSSVKSGGKKVVVKNSPAKNNSTTKGSSKTASKKGKR